VPHLLQKPRAAITKARIIYYKNHEHLLQKPRAGYYKNHEQLLQKHETYYKSTSSYYKSTKICGLTA